MTPRTLKRVPACLLAWLWWLVPNLSAAAVIVLRLPDTVAFHSFSNTSGATEIRLSANALTIGFPAVPVGATVQTADGSCVIRISPGAEPAPGFQIVPAGAGPLAIEISPGLIAAPTRPGAGSPATPAPPVAPAVVRGEPPPAANPSAITSPPPSAPTPASTPAVAAGRGPPPPAANPGIGNPAPPSQPAPTAGPAPVARVAKNAVAPITTSAADLEGALVKIFPELGPVGFDPVAKADYALPESTAATAIGGSNPLVRPATPREVVTSLLTNFDDKGKLQTGLSLAITPYTLLRREPLSADEYDRQPGARFLANLQLSLAGRPDSAVVTNGQTATRFSTGLSMVFFDQGDLRRDRTLLSGIASTLHQEVTTATFETAGGMLPPIPPEKLAAGKKLWDDAKKKNWNAASAGLGVAPAWLSLTGQVSDATFDGLVVWSSLALPGPGALADSMQFILGGNGRFNQQVRHKNAATKADEWTQTKVIDYAAQLRFGAESFSFFVQGTYRRSTFWNDHHRGKFVYELGAETRVGQGVWLNLAWSSAEAMTGGSALRSGVRYGFGSKAVLAPQPRPAP